MNFPFKTKIIWLPEIPRIWHFWTLFGSLSFSGRGACVCKHTERDIEREGGEEKGGRKEKEGGRGWGGSGRRWERRRKRGEERHRARGGREKRAPHDCFLDFFSFWCWDSFNHNCKYTNFKHLAFWTKQNRYAQKIVSSNWKTSFSSVLQFGNVNWCFFFF